MDNQCRFQRSIALIVVFSSTLQLYTSTFYFQSRLLTVRVVLCPTDMLLVACFTYEYTRARSLGRDSPLSQMSINCLEPCLNSAQIDLIIYDPEFELVWLPR